MLFLSELYGFEHPIHTYKNTSTEGGGEPIRLRCERLRKLHSNKIDQSASTFKPLAATATAKKETEHVSNSKKHTQEEWNGFLRYYKCFVCGELGHIEESHQI